MKITEKQSAFIKEAFRKMKDKHDFLELMNYTKAIIYGKDAFPFELRQINYYSFAPENRNRYFQFSIKKKSGLQRTIHAPVKGLKAIQKCLNLIFQQIYYPGPAATGFVPSRSILDNAKIHAGSLYVYNLDLKDFFPGIDQARVWGRLKFPPFNLNEQRERLELANIIASLCCHEMEVERQDENNDWKVEIRKVLPQGAPTSPTLSNIICQQLDFYLTAVAKRFNLKYSRYADDITFSSMHNVYQKDSAFIKELHRIISEQGFHIKDSKTRLQKKGYRQEVTGLVVNEKPNVKKKYIKELRLWLYLWETYGYKKASVYFSEKYDAEGNIIKVRKSGLSEVISGKLNYLKMVVGKENNNYRMLRNRFDKLIGKENKIEKILNLIEKEGLDEILNRYDNEKGDILL